MRRSIRTIATTAALAVAATACGTSDAGGSTDGELSGTVTFWDTSNETEAKVFERIAQDFEKEHPGVAVDYVNIGYDGAQNRFKNAAAANEAPDVMRTEVAWVSDFASLGYLYPLDDTALGERGDFLDQAWASTQYEGTTYAVPQVIDALAVYYNRSLLDEAGVEVPETWDDVKKSRDEFEDAGTTPMYLRGDDSYYFLPLLYGEGGDLVDAGAQEVTIDDDAGVAAFEQLQELVDSGAVLTDTSDGYENMLSSFGDGEVAMIIDGPWDAATLQEELGDDLGIAAVPAGSAGQGSPQGGWNYSVYAGTPEAEASLAFVEYMASAEVQQQVAEELNLLPTRESVYDEPSIRDNETIQSFRTAVDVAHERPWIPEANSLFEPLTESIEGMLTGSATPKEAADGTGDEYRDILEDWQ